MDCIPEIDPDPVIQGKLMVLLPKKIENVLPGFLTFSRLTNAFQSDFLMFSIFFSSFTRCCE